jgi:hypothetical protein
MLTSLKKILIRIADPARNRKFLLSYPKSGRTWLLNVFTNYIYRTQDNIAVPVKFIKEQNNEFGKRLKSEGIVFTHGFTLSKSNDEMKRSLESSFFGSRKTCLLIRNPLRTMYSYFIHINRFEPDKDQLWEFLDKDHRGLERYCIYHNLLLPEMIGKINSNLIFYEDINEKNEEYKYRFRELFGFFFGSNLNDNAMEWAIEQCRLNNLKERSNVEPGNGNAGKRQRIREGLVTVDKSSLLSSMKDDIVSGLRKKLDPDVFTFFEKRYFIS